MGFAGGGRTLPSQLPYQIILCIALYTANSLWHLYIYVFMLAWGFTFWMWRLTLVHLILFPLSAEYSVVMCWAWLGSLVIWPWHRLGMTYSCALWLWSQICIACQSCWFPELVALSCCAKVGCFGPRGMTAYIRDGYGAFCHQSLSGCCKILFFRVCGVRQNYMWSVFTTTLT